MIKARDKERESEFQGKTRQTKTATSFSFSATKILFINNNYCKKLDRSLLGRIWDIR